MKISERNDDLACVELNYSLGKSTLRKETHSSSFRNRHQMTSALNSLN